MDSMKALIAALVVGVTSILGLLFFGLPYYNVWQQGMSGKAELSRADSNRKIATLEATAKNESAKQLSEAEITRARGVAEANRIIGDSLKGNEAYLHYLWIHNLSEGKNDVIYIPTEAGMPILEANRLNSKPQPATE